jgi:hypothetical protein
MLAPNSIASLKEIYPIYRKTVLLFLFEKSAPDLDLRDLRPI